MTVSELRDTYSWQTAVELGPQLVRLAEELPASEQFGLAQELRTGMVSVPAAIAADLLHDQSARQPAVLRLIAALELLERVYPALDTLEVRSAVDQLAERLLSGNFSERIKGSAPAQPAPPAPEDVELEAGEMSEGVTIDLPNPGEAHATVAPPPTLPAPVSAPAPTPVPPPHIAAPAASSVPITPAQPVHTIHVQPDSSQ